MSIPVDEAIVTLGDTVLYGDPDLITYLFPFGAVVDVKLNSPIDVIGYPRPPDETISGGLIG